MLFMALNAMIALLLGVILWFIIPEASGFLKYLTFLAGGVLLSFLILYPASFELMVVMVVAVFLCCCVMGLLLTAMGYVQMLVKAGPPKSWLERLENYSTFVASWFLWTLGLITILFTVLFSEVYYFSKETLQLNARV